MAYTPNNQEISKYWDQYRSDPNALKSGMQQYNLDPFAVSKATGTGLQDVFKTLGGDVNAGFQDGSNNPYIINGKIYQPTYTSQGGGGEAGDTQSTLSGYRVLNDHPEWDNDQGRTNYSGAAYDLYDPNGNKTYSGNLSNSIGKDPIISDMTPFLIAGAGFGAGMAGMGTFGAGAANAVNFGTNPVLAGAGGVGAGGVGGATAAGVGAGNSFDGGVLNDVVMNGTGSGAGGITTSGALENSFDNGTMQDILNGGPGVVPPPPAPLEIMPPLDTSTLPVAPTFPDVMPPLPPLPGGTPPGGTVKPPIIPPINPGGGGDSGGGNKTGGITLDDIIKNLGGAVDWYKQNQAGDGLLNYLKSQQAKIDNLYADGSPEKQLMQQTLDRKDAAAGRMSQYGTRATDLAGRIAQIKADATTRMTTGIGALYKAGLDKKASAPSGLFSSLNQNGGLANMLSKLGVTGQQALDYMVQNFGMTPDMGTDFLKGMSDPSVYSAAKTAADQDSADQSEAGMGTIFDDWFKGDN